MRAAGLGQIWGNKLPTVHPELANQLPGPCLSATDLWCCCHNEPMC